MDFSFLPLKIKLAICKLNIDKLTEIRLRKDFPIIIKYSGKRLYLSDCGMTSIASDAIICKEEDILNIIEIVTEYSIYAFNDRIKDGYITTKDGVRIGLAGECVNDNGQVVTIKNITSINIRVPKLIDGCSCKIFNYIYKNKIINNTLIISPPTLGKTTILKDLANKIDKLNKYSILIIDERGEFSQVKGENIDSIMYSSKLYSFQCGVRSLAPDLIITDELYGESDWNCVKNICCSGIKIIASCHGDNFNNLLKKEYFIKDVFDRYVFLRHDKVGKIGYVYDKDFQVVCD